MFYPTTCVRFGTGVADICLADFLGSLLTRAVCLPEGSQYCQVQLEDRICLEESAPTPLNRLFRQSAAVSLLRPRFTPGDSNGIFTVSSIGSASRLPLRSRLTLIRLALIRKPWSFGVEVSRLHYRYLYLHLLFRTLQPASPPTFAAVRNAPLPITP